MTGSYERTNYGRSNCPCNKKTLNRAEKSYSTMNSNGGDLVEPERIKVHDFSERLVGKDGSYYHCDVCHGVGTLLHCEICQSAFHLECLEPPMECVPAGLWLCQKCCHLDGSYASASKSPIRSYSCSKVKPSTSKILSLGKKQLKKTSYVSVDPKSRFSAADKKLPAASLISPDKLVKVGNVLEKASEADARSGNQGKSAIKTRGVEKGTQRGSTVGELKGDERSTRKKKVRTEEGVNLGELPRSASDKMKGNDKDKPVTAHNAVEIAGTAVEVQREPVVVCPDLNELPHSGSPDVILQDKLMIPRDISQTSANSHFFSQNDELSDSQLETHLSSEEAEAQKETPANLLCTKQKARVAKTVKKLGEPAPGSRPSRTEGPVQVHEPILTGFSGPLNKPSGAVYIGATPLCMSRPDDSGNEGTKQSSENTDKRKNLSENISVNNHQNQSNHNEGLGDQFPGFVTKEAPNPECLTAASVKRQKGISQLPSPFLRTSRVPQPRDFYPCRTSTSDFFSVFPMPSTDYNNLRKVKMDETWTNKELDSLWIGVRKYRQGNWLQMLTDPNLCFSRGKIGADLAKRWEKEKASHFGAQVTSSKKPSERKRKMINIDLNLEPPEESTKSSEDGGKEKGEEPKWLVGIHIEIPVNEAVGEEGKQMK